MKSLSEQKLSYKFDVYHLADNSERQCKAKETSRPKFYLTSSNHKQCPKWGLCSQIQHKSTFSDDNTKNLYTCNKTEYKYLTFYLRQCKYTSIKI